METTAQTSATLDALAARVAELEMERGRLAELEETHARQRARIAVLEEENALLRRPAARFGLKRTNPSRVGAPQMPTGTPDRRTSRRGLMRLGGAAAAAGVAAVAANVATGTRTAHASGVAWATGSVAADVQTYVSPSSGSYSDPTILSTQYGTGTVYQPFASQTAGVAGYDTVGGGGFNNGVLGTSGSGNGVTGITATGYAVLGNSQGSGYALYGLSASGSALLAGNGSYARAHRGSLPARRPLPTGSGVGTPAITSSSDIGAAVDANSNVGDAYSAVFANGTSGTNGLNASSDTGYGMIAHSSSGTAISAGSGTGSAVVASSSGVGYGLYLTAPSGWAIGCVGRIRVIGNSAGTATILAGHTAITVPTTACSAVSLVIVTPLADPGARVWTTRAAGVFTIHVSSAPAANLDFTYLLLN